MGRRGRIMRRASIPRRGLCSRYLEWRREAGRRALQGIAIGSYNEQTSPAGVHPHDIPNCAEKTHQEHHRAQNSAQHSTAESCHTTIGQRDTTQRNTTQPSINATQRNTKQRTHHISTQLQNTYHNATQATQRHNIMQRNTTQLKATQHKHISNPPSTPEHSATQLHSNANNTSHDAPGNAAATQRNKTQ
jgi:hypothetical protein